MPKGRGKIGQAGATSLAVIFFALISFTSQAIVTQTHIHVGTRAGVASDLNGTNGGPAKQQLPTKSPSHDDPANCPICQALLHAGSYVTPSFATMMPPTMVAHIVATTVELVAIAQPRSHGWKSRAPPLA